MAFEKIVSSVFARAQEKNRMINVSAHRRHESARSDGQFELVVLVHRQSGRSGGTDIPFCGGTDKNVCAP